MVKRRRSARKRKSSAVEGDNGGEQDPPQEAANAAASSADSAPPADDSAPPGDDSGKESSPGEEAGKEPAEEAENAGKEPLPSNNSEGGEGDTAATADQQKDNEATPGPSDENDGDRDKDSPPDETKDQDADPPSNQDKDDSDDQDNPANQPLAWDPNAPGMSWHDEDPKTALKWQLEVPTFPARGWEPQPEFAVRQRKIHHVQLRNQRVQHERCRLGFVGVTQTRRKAKCNHPLVSPLHSVVKKSSDRHDVWMMSQMKHESAPATYGWRCHTRYFPKLSINVAHLNATHAFYLEKFDADNSGPIMEALKAKNACTLQVIRVGIDTPNAIICSVTFRLKRSTGAMLDYLATTPHGENGDQSTHECEAKGLGLCMLHFVQTFSLSVLGSNVVWLHCTLAIGPQPL